MHGGAVSIAQQDNNHYSPTWIVTYTPPTDYAGPDSFEFNVVERDSPYSIIATGTVSIEMINVPVAVDSTSDYVVPHLGSCPITLSCTSPLGLPLTFSLVQAPTKGGLSGIAQPINGGTLQTASLYYVPSRKAASSDSFAFRATPNGVNYSAPATIGISIAEDKPIALEQDQVDASSGLAVITLTATDAAGSRLNFKVSQPTDGGILSEVTQPRGSGSIQCAQVTYSIGLNNGSSDTFTFWVDNNSSISDSVTVNVLLA